MFLLTILKYYGILIFDEAKNIKHVFRRPTMTKIDYLNEINGLSKEEQIKILRDYYDKFETEKNLVEQIVVCELLATDFDFYGYKIMLPQLYYYSGEYEKVIDYVDTWCAEIKDDWSSVAITLPQIKLWEIKAYKRIGKFDKAIYEAELVCNISKQVIANMKSNIGENGNFSLQETPLAIALCEIGEIYFDQKNYDKASDYFLQSRNVRLTYSNGYYLGYLCLHGIGGAPKDIKLAINHLNSISSETAEEYVNNGDKSDMLYISKACYLLGEIYSTESGFKNKEKAIEQYQKAKLLGYNISNEEIEQKTANIQNSGVNTNKSGGCYVATCVYGSYDCPQVWTLRRFRDEILANSFFGRLFIKTYYAVSPTFVNLFGNQEWFHKLFKSPLDRLVKKLQEKGIDNTPYQD